MEPRSAEDRARTFGTWEVWFEWGSLTSDGRGEGVPPMWFARRGEAALEAIPAIDLTEAGFRKGLRGFMSELRVEAAWREFQPRITATSLGQVLTPRPTM
jgi:hypothetical protein